MIFNTYIFKNILTKLSRQNPFFQTGIVTDNLLCCTAGYAALS